MSAAAVLAVTGSDIIQNTVGGFALGSKYALIALGFVIVFRATGIINFAQGGFVLLGAYLTYNFANTWGLNFYVALLLAMVCGFALGVVLEWAVLRRLVGQPVFAAIMVTIGILFVIDNLVTAVWGSANLTLGDPWTGRTVQAGGIVVLQRDIWSVLFAASVLAAFTLFFRYSSMGLAMRATAMDQEAALAQGISARTVYRLAWGIAGLVAALAGATLATGTGNLQPGVGLLALAAFPAMILGGMDSPLGAVIGGVVIGIVQNLSALFAPDYLEWAGRTPEVVAPYVVMVIILMVRPYGLFGTAEVRRV